MVVSVPAKKRRRSAVRGAAAPVDRVERVVVRVSVRGWCVAGGAAKARERVSRVKGLRLRWRQWRVRNVHCELLLRRVGRRSVSRRVLVAVVCVRVVVRGRVQASGPLRRRVS